MLSNQWLEELIDKESAYLTGRTQSEDLRYLLRQIKPIEFSPEDHEEIVLFSTRNHPHYNYLYPLMAYQLTEWNIPTYFLFRHVFISDIFPDIIVKDIQITNSIMKLQYPYLYRSGQVSYPHFNWKIDLQNEIVSVNGLNINFFPTFLRTIQKDNKRYHIDFRNPDNARKIQLGILTADEFIRHFQLLEHWAQQHEVKVKIVGWESHYLPHGLIKQYCQNQSSQNGYLEFIHLGPLYGHYVGERLDFGYYIGSCNYTTRDVYHPVDGFREEYEEYLDIIRNNPELTEEVTSEIHEDLEENILGRPEETVNLSPDQSQGLKDRIDSTRSNGNNVYCLFAHQFFDLPLWDEGYVFDDMCDWIDQTLELFRSRDDLLMLKPHPGEVRENSSEEPNEKLSDFVEGKIDAENIVLLGPRDIGSAALYQQIDCGLVWRSSIGIEMTVLGLPCVVSGKAHWRSYFKLSQPKNLDEYISSIDEVPHHTIGKEEQTRAAVFLHFFKHYLHHFVPYIKNVDYGGLDPTIIRWNYERLETFIQEGDDNIDAILHQLNINKLDNLWSVEDELRRQFPELMGEGTTSNA